MATLTKGKTFTNGELVTPQKLHELVDLGTVSGIVNADIANNAAIADTKLATISTAGKVSNSATTATSANTANALVARDATGNFSAGTITAALSGNASSATTSAACSGNAATASKLATARTITLGGDLSGSVSFDGSANATLTAAVLDDSHNHVISNIDGLQTALDGKQASGSYAPATGIAPSAITGTAVITTDSRLSDARTPTAHNHDASAINAGTLAIARIPTGATATTVCIGNDTRLSDARTPTTHTHDDRYYTEAEIDTKLSGLPVSGHTHDDRYYTETEMNTLLAGKQASGSYAAASHTHDDRYYTETEMNTLLAGKQASGSYAAASHTHAATDITSGTLANARTTATNSNTANAIVARDASGNFSASTITGTLSGNASTASNLATARSISLTGDVTGSVAFDGSANVSIAAVVADDSHNHTIANVDGLQTALDGKQATGSYAPATGIAQSAVTNLTTDLAGKAASSHTHTIANVTGLQTALDGKQASGSYVTNGGNVSSIQRVTAMPATPAANTLYIVIP